MKDEEIGLPTKKQLQEKMKSKINGTDYLFYKQGYMEGIKFVMDNPSKIFKNIVNR